MSLVDLRPGLRAFLAADAAIAALVVAAGKTHIYQQKLPRGLKRTALVFAEISAQGDHNNAGPSGLATPRLQLAAWGVTADAAHGLALAVKERIDGYRGPMGSGADEVTVLGVFFDNWRDVDDTEAELQGKLADYIFWYRER